MNRKMARQATGSTMALAGFVLLLLCATGSFGTATPLPAALAIYLLIRGLMLANEQNNLIPRRPWDYEIDGD